MSKLPEKYDAKTTENKWRKIWTEKKIYQFHNDLPREQTFVIDTPPPTVSGLLHMGHVFSYTQADFVARYNRMRGKDVFYPMGFDDNGLPTERLVEKIIGKKAMVYEAEECEKNAGGSGYFVAKCREVVQEAEAEFEDLFNEIALSVDWEQKYQTISPESQKISQASFVDLYQKGLVEKQNQPVFWDIADRTALAQADIIDKEVEGEMFFINFAIDGKSEPLEIMTTRPELLPACVAVMINGADERYKNLIQKPLNQEGEGETGSFAITPIFGVKVKIIADNSVQIDKGTGVVMCCTFGDETDVEWWEKNKLPLRAIIGESGILGGGVIFKSLSKDKIEWDIFAGNINENNCLDVENFVEVFRRIVEGNTLKKTRELIINELSKILSKSSIPNSSKEGESKSPSDFGGSLSPSSDLNSNPQNQSFIKIKSQKITRPVKCAERSGVPIEFLIRPQWYIKIRDKKEQLKRKAHECNWYPEYMRVRIEQWIDGLSRDWCISRQRFFGVKIPVWYSQRKGEAGKILVASLNQLPCDPFVDLPEGYARDEVIAENDVLDTWATSSITPQLSSKGISDEICFDKARHEKLFPADMRPQAHEIIRTWAFYTIVKAYLHSLEIIKDQNGEPQKNQDGSIKLQENSNSNQTIPWKNLMISGWCLASDKTKMSKSKGNVVTPTALIVEKSADVVRYWASASNLGADIAYSEEVFKIGQKLITKIFNSAKFCSQHFATLEDYYFKKFGNKNFNDEKLIELITHTSDLWVLARLEIVIKEYNKQFEIFEYAKAREVLEEFFWHYFCDNYLEICKVRSYGLSAEKLAGVDLTEENTAEIVSKQISALASLSLCLKNILKLFAPFIPHITEEIYATIFANEFAQKKSIHARKNYAELSSQLTKNPAEIIKIGDEILKILFEVRKFKSEKNLSMKTPIALLKIGSKLDLSGVIDDISNVCTGRQARTA
ncbi:MAG: valine--tRNA ligase [Proteobacteria bacterium]|nr:valine--tRNA ligase [Pseudomonadota bacterium]